MPSSIDRLSDDVICHILSFLRIKASASTSVLSRRWRFLWAHAPNLDFIGYEFGDETRASDIIHRIIALHRARTMNTLSITDVNCSGYQLATWISHAVNRRARSLHLDFGGVRNLYIDFEEYDVNINALFTLPKCLLTCKTFVGVKLRCCRGIPSSGNVFLPCLKKLHLSHIVYEDEKSLPHLLSSCPVLQDLTIKCVYAMKLNGDDLSCVFVSSPTIKILNVDLEYGCRVLKINAPSLVYLNVRSYSLEDVTSLTTMTSLVEADITLYGLECWADDEIIEEYSNAVDFLNCLSNVKCLKILVDYNDMVVNIAGLDSMVKFDNLTELKLELMIDFQELVKFIGVAVNLEALTFSLDGMYFTSSYREPEQVSACMLSCLKIVRIKPSDEFNAHDFESIRYVLKNAQVLERMKLLYSNSNSRSDMEKLGVLRRIPLLEKGSESCELAFY